MYGCIEDEPAPQNRLLAPPATGMLSRCGFAAAPRQTPPPAAGVFAQNLKECDLWESPAASGVTAGAGGQPPRGAVYLLLFLGEAGWATAKTRSSITPAPGA